MAEEPNPVASLESRMGPVPDSLSPVVASGPAIDPAEATAQERNDLVESSYEVDVKLVNMQGDPNSPLYSVKRFEDLGM